MDRLGGNKHSAKNIRARIGPIRSKKQATVRCLKKDVADLIAAGHEANTYGRVRIEDPFKRMENAARTVHWVELPKISNAFQNAHNKLSSGSVLSDRDSLLSLLTRPFLASKFQIERIEEILAMSNGKTLDGETRPIRA
ncbi:hypothetical protein ZIOFF_073112 [Zingiber officinale]|uniref:Uncharacterized protein n=1 Tax=Zingiber officinale TaxID=94328 RepID=A0A8J5C3Y8_ZINOF|nr:hypothetical protein ZIOFF_073112 [Zingiber officinale]